MNDSPEVRMPPELERAILGVLSRQRGKPASSTITLHTGYGSRLTVTVSEPGDGPTVRRIERLICGDT